MFQIHRMCFSNQLTIHKVIIKVRHSFVIKNWWSKCNFFLNFYVSHGGATRFLRDSGKHYVYFVDISLLFPTVQDFSQSVNSRWSYCKN